MSQIVHDVIDDIHILRLNRPEALNALSGALVAELTAAVINVETTGSARAIILCSTSSRAFSAGADVKEIDQISSAQFRSKNDLGAALFNRLEQSGIVSIAALDGHVLGGGLELALACDFRVVTPRTNMAFPEITRGFIPGWGGIARLVELAGLGFAKEVIFTGRQIEVHDALERKIVHRVAEPADLESVALDLARQIPVGRELNIRYAKHIFSELVDAPRFSPIETLFVDSLMRRKNDDHGL